MYRLYNFRHASNPLCTPWDTRLFAMPVVQINKADFIALSNSAALGYFVINVCNCALSYLIAPKASILFNIRKNMSPSDPCANIGRRMALLNNKYGFVFKFLPEKTQL